MWNIMENMVGDEYACIQPFQGWYFYTSTFTPGALP